MVSVGAPAPRRNSPTTTGFPDVGTTSAVPWHSRMMAAASWAPRSTSALWAGSMLTVGISTIRSSAASKGPRMLMTYDSVACVSGVAFIAAS